MTIDVRVREILMRQTRIHLVELVRARHDRYYDLAAKCESPIEELLLAPLMFIAPRCLARRYDGPGDYPIEARLHVQHEVAKRRVDFAYIVRPHLDTRPIKIAIECDGHDYHSSREQREDDSARQNELQGSGFALARFTGSQINRDPEGCAQQVADMVDRIFADRIHEATNALNMNDEEDEGRAA